MKKFIHILFIFCLFFEFALAKKVSSAITYIKPKGRLGDQLFCYCKAKWVSFKHDIPLYYQPFEYSNKVYLFQVDEIYEDNKVKHLEVQRLKGFKNNFEYIYIDSDFKDQNTLYIIDQCFYPEIWRNLINDIQAKIIHPYKIDYNSTFVQKGINNPKARHDEMIMGFKQDRKFIKELRKFIKPLYKLTEIKKPQNLVSVAVHVRKGGGFDKPYKSIQEYETNLQIQHYVDFIHKETIYNYRILSNLRDAKISISPNTYSIFKEKFIDIPQPLKHPPDQFYIDQIKGLSAMLGDVPLFIYIFTDDQNPSDIMQRFKKAICNSNMTFACRQTGNNYYSNILDDLFAMSTFDCLIRPYSSLSQIAELLGKHKIVISPRHGVWYGDRLIIDEILIVSDNDFCSHIRNSNQLN